MNKHAAPEFAMSFTQDAVLLERRDGLDWRPLGQARFAGGNLSATLQALRADPGLDPADLDTVVVIPDDQILYTTLTVSPGADLPATIARALEGMTPYSAEDLAFDWCPDADGKIDSLRVAVVARRTLEEAEDFARAQGFRPSGFVSRPGDDRFEGQPDFGLSRLAQEQHSAALPFSKPDLNRVAVTSDRIQIDEAPAPEVIISRIVPHHLPPAPAPVATAEPASVPDEVAADAPPAEIADQPVAQDALAAAPAVIRHGEPRLGGATDKMSPRARAVHTRAAEARARRAPAEEKAPEKLALLARLRNFKPRTLTVLIGLLLFGLLLTLLFWGSAPTPQSQPPQVAQTETPVTDPQPETTPVATDSAALPAPAEPAPESESPVELAEEQAPAAIDSTLSEAVTAAATTAQTQVPAPSDTAAANVPVDALTAALTEALSGTDRATAPQAPDPVALAATAQGEAARIAAGQPALRAVLPTETAQTPTAAAPVTPPSATTAPAPAVTQAATTGLRLKSSARPPRAAPPARAAAPASPDSRPTVPANPLPYAQRTQAEPSRVTGQRPPNRPAVRRATTPAAIPAAAPAPAAVVPAPRSESSSPRPPARPDDLTRLEEGSASEDGAPTELTRTERASLEQLLRDLRTAEAGNPGLRPAERNAVIRLAQARPQRKPLSIAGPSEEAVRNAVAEAVASSERPPSTRDDKTASASSGGGGGSGLSRSARPLSRPGAILAKAGPDGGGGSRTGPASGNASLSSQAVNDAIAAAVQNSSALPGAVALTALSSSAIPPRRSDSNRNTASDPAPTAPTADDLRAAAEAQASEQGREAALAEQRRQDAELQAQAEARTRARADADARAEAQARAAAEARARAQAEAEARAASSRRQTYTPPEAENEPDVASQIPEGRTVPGVAGAATIKGGIQINRTQIIGTVGAGKASRALVRLSNGRIITLRLGDRINGGTITEIGDSRITFVKGGRPQQLSVLNGQ